MERVGTGIQGLDNLIEGGFPKGSSILVSGSPGTGKTILGLQFLVEGINNNEDCAYISLGEGLKDIKEQAEEFGWNLEKAEENESLEMKKVKPRDFGDKLSEYELSKKEADRIVIDSISPITDSEGKDARNLLHDVITGIKDSGATILFISELGSEGGLSRDGVSEYVCDGVIKLTLLEDLDVRKIEVKKLRSTKIETFKPQNFGITEDGIQFTG